ncbi:MAG: DHHW family protein [Aminipila sp.]
MRDKRAIVTSTGFVILLICLLLLCMITPDKAFSDNENRQLQQMPELKAMTVASGEYMKKFEMYASDNIAARDEWVRIKNITDIISGKKDNGGAYFGKDGYLFPIETIDENQLEKNLNYVKTFIKNVHDQDKSVNISVLFAPTSAEILKEKMPQYAPAPNQGKILNKAQQNFGSMLVNPTSMLLAHKDEYIYYKTDHHWTTLGAYYSYKLWAEQNNLVPINKNQFNIKVVNSEFYGTTYSKAVGFKVEPDSIEKFSNNKIDSVGMKIENLKQVKHFDSLYDEKYLGTKDKYSYFLSGNNPMTIIEGTSQNNHSILVVKDSYANCFVPFITQNFENVYVVDLRYYKESLLELIKEKGITDVLFLYNTVQFSNDRNLVYLLKA